MNRINHNLSQTIWDAANSGFDNNNDSVVLEQVRHGPAIRTRKSRRIAPQHRHTQKLFIGINNYAKMTYNTSLYEPCDATATVPTGGYANLSLCKTESEWPLERVVSTVVPVFFGIIGLIGLMGNALVIIGEYRLCRGKKKINNIKWHR